MTSNSSNPKAKLVHTVDVTTLPQSGFVLPLVANETQREQLAMELDVLSVEKLDCELTFRSWKRKGIRVKGRIKARITQACVVTLDPVSQEIDEEFEVTFAPEGSSLLKPATFDDGEVIVDYEGDDPPEAFDGRSLDAWDIVIEQLALVIDPFPRKTGAKIDPALQAIEEEQEVETSPFAVLEQLKNRKDQ